MIQNSTPSGQANLVLIGGGHSHVVALRELAERPLPGVRVILICTDTETPYSGMLPGYVAGHYRFEEVHINLQRLADFAGATYLNDAVTGIDRQSRRVLCEKSAPIPYDFLSVNIGSTPQMPGVAAAREHVIPVKPIRCFNERWLALLERVRHKPGGPLAIAVVGAGAGGVEMVLAIQYRLRKEVLALGGDPEEISYHLFSADHEILATHNAQVGEAFDAVLAERGVRVYRGAEVVQITRDRLQTRDGQIHRVDATFWVTGAGGADWLRDTGLSLDKRGFIRVRNTLQTEEDPRIFAAGDCASMIDYPLEKAGVFAVRMGRPLAGNLRNALLGKPLQPYRPQARWLALITTGNKHAIASRGAFYARGDLLWRWKDWIDRRFMRRYTVFD